MFSVSGFVNIDKTNKKKSFMNIHTKVERKLQ